MAEHYRHSSLIICNWLKNIKVCSMCSRRRPFKKILKCVDLFNLILEENKTVLLKQDLGIINNVIKVDSPFNIKSRFTKDDYLELSSTWDGLDKRQRRCYNARPVYSVTYSARLEQPCITV